MIKYSYRFNYHTIREKIINYGIAIEEYSSYSQREDWCYMIQYKDTLKAKVNFIIKLHKKILMNLCAIII